MANLDSLGWAGGFSVACHGVEFGIRVTDAAVLPLIERHLPLGSEPASAEAVDYLYSAIVAGGTGAGLRRKMHLLFGGTNLISRQRSFDGTVEDLERATTSLVGTKSPVFVYVHAGVVEWEGRALVIPGRSFSGKTTMVTSLLRLGCRYLSDEFALFDDQGRVHPYPRPLGVRHHGETKGERTEPFALGATVGDRPLPLGWVVDTPYDADATWDVTPVSPGRASMALLANSLPAREDPSRVMAVLSHACSSAQAWSGIRGDAVAAATSLLGSITSA